MMALRARWTRLKTWFITHNTRDDRKWFVLQVGGLLTALAAHSDEFLTNGVPPIWVHALGNAAIVVAVVASHLRTSPLPGRE